MPHSNESNSRRSFTLGGFTYYAPEIIGAGIQAEYLQNLNLLALESPHFDRFAALQKKAWTDDEGGAYQRWKKMEQARADGLAANMNVSSLDAVLPDMKRAAQSYDPFATENLLAITQLFVKINPAASTIAVFNSMLTPADGSPDPSIAFKSAKKGEVEAITSFFSGTGTSSTEEESLTNSRGAALAKKKAAR